MSDSAENERPVANADEPISRVEAPPEGSAGEDAAVGSSTAPPAGMKPDAPVELPVTLAVGRPVRAASDSRGAFRFGMSTFLIGSVLFSLQFLAWNLLGVLVGSIVNVALILIATVVLTAVGLARFERKSAATVQWDRMLVRAMLAFYLMAGIAVFAGGGKLLTDFLAERRVRYVVHQRYGFAGEEALAIEGEKTVRLIAVDDVDPNGRFARAGVLPGTALILTCEPDDFYARLNEPDAPTWSLDMVAVSGSLSIAPDITKKPRRNVQIELSDGS